MKFAIAVPVLGQADFLPTALSSLQSQSQPLEVAIMDATPDQSVQTVVAGSGLRPVYSRHGSDAGQAAAISEGWNQTQGDILGWLCADDYLFPDTLAQVAQIFRDQPFLDAVYGNAVHVDARGDFLQYFPAIDHPTALNSGCCIAQPACFVRREAVSRIGGLDQSRHYTMDWDLWLRLNAVGAKFRYVDALFAAVRVYPQTKTLSRAEARYRELTDLLRRHSSTTTTLTSLIGYRYYDMVHTRSTPLEHLAYYAIGSVRKLRRLLPKTDQRRIVHGLECWTNHVRNTCEVILPWWDSGVPQEAVILSDHPTHLTVSTPDRSQRVLPSGSETMTFNGRRVRANQFRIPTPRAEGHILKICLAADAPWTLYGVRFTASSDTRSSVAPI